MGLESWRNPGLLSQDSLSDSRNFLDLLKICFSHMNLSFDRFLFYTVTIKTQASPPATASPPQLRVV